MRPPFGLEAMSEPAAGDRVAGDGRDPPARPAAQNAERAMTPERLQAIVERDRKARIYTDRFGGQYMRRCDILASGAQACIDRRALLEELKSDQVAGAAPSDPHA